MSFKGPFPASFYFCLFNTSWKCIGIIRFANDWILTADHCLDDKCLLNQFGPQHTALPARNSGRIVQLQRPDLPVNASLLARLPRSNPLPRHRMPPSALWSLDLLDSALYARHCSNLFTHLRRRVQWRWSHLYSSWGNFHLRQCCDQMPRVFVQHLAICNNGNSFNGIKYWPK